jgi:hypothetical protein
MLGEKMDKNYIYDKAIVSLMFVSRGSISNIKPWRTHG